MRHEVRREKESERERERERRKGARSEIFVALVLSCSLCVIECFRRKNGKALLPGAYL